MSAVLNRETFESSRLLEYFTAKELQQQIGLDPEYWPLAILRELIDNALDACEESCVLPVIDISTANDTIIVRDNGPGIPPETIARSLDYLVRVSNKAYYVSPTRGAMGNALKVVWAAPFVATGSGAIEIETRGERHTVTVSLDRIAQRPEIGHEVVKIRDSDHVEVARLIGSETDDSYKSVDGSVKNGTSVKIRWSDSARYLVRESDDSYKLVSTAADLVAGFAAFNPHARFTLDGERFERTVTKWPKWSPNQPTSAHWYTEETLRDLIAAYITRERNTGTAKTVREFVAGFRGLSGTAKQKAVTEGWGRSHLRDFVVEGDVDPDFVRELLSRIQATSAAPAPKALGVIGKDHLTAWMMAHGVSVDSIRYTKKAGIDTDGLPFVLEIAFGVNQDDDSTRRIVTGLNCSPVISGDPDPTLRAAIAEARLDPHDPVTLVVHITRPRFQFADRGKTRVAL